MGLSAYASIVDRQRGIVGVIFRAVSAVSKESRRSVLPRTCCYVCVRRSHLIAVRNPDVPVTLSTRTVRQTRTDWSGTSIRVFPSSLPHHTPQAVYLQPVVGKAQV
jgi:hypothetical protein